MSGMKAVKQLAMLPLIIYLNKMNFEGGPWETPIIATFVAVQVMQLLYCNWLFGQVAKTTEEGTIDVKAPTVMGQKQGEDKTVTVKQYDFDKVSELRKEILTSTLIIGLIVWKFETLKPCLFTLFQVPLNVWDQPLFQVYVRGQQAVGELKRPWVKPSPFAMPTPPEESKEVEAEEKKEIEDSKETTDEQKVPTDEQKVSDKAAEVENEPKGKADEGLRARKNHEQKEEEAERVAELAD